MIAGNGSASSGGVVSAALDHFGARTLAALPPRVFPVALDVGAGSGLSLATLGDRCPTLLAVDLDPAALPDGATAAQWSATCLAADAEHLPVRDGVVDLIHWGFLAPHVRDLQAALREAARVLRPGGTFAAVTWVSRGGSPLTGIMSDLLARCQSQPDRARAAWAEVATRSERFADECAVAGLDVWYTTKHEWFVMADSTSHWRASLLGETTGLSRALWALNKDDRAAILREFSAAASQYILADGQLSIPCRAVVLMAERP